MLNKSESWGVGNRESGVGNRESGVGRLPLPCSPAPLLPCSPAPPHPTAN
ncbi:hypothetical protein [Spirulina subsalsa]|nr:hypothetical protein [Spirulina subsalsa]